MEKPKESADHRIKKRCIGPGYLRMMWCSSEETFREQLTSTLVSPVLDHPLLQSSLEWQCRPENTRRKTYYLAINYFSSYEVGEGKHIILGLVLEKPRERERAVRQIGERCN